MPPHTASWYKRGEEFKYLGILLTRDLKKKACSRSTNVLDQWQQCYSHITGLWWWRRISVCGWSFFFTSQSMSPGQELWVVTKRIWLWVKEPEIRFLLRLSVLTLCDRVRSLTLQESIGVESPVLWIEMRQLRWLGHLQGCPLVIFL